MRKEIIIFKDKKPKTRKEICSTIEHFCKDHNLEYQFLSQRGPVRVYMDGILYETELQKGCEEKPAYWMIYCKHQTAQKQAQA